MIVRGDIQKFANAIGRQFHPDRIILFGSHARGDTTADSDVDLLVIMPRNGKTAHEQAVEIRRRIPRQFALDLLVRTAEEIEQRMGMNDWFMHEALQQGITLYEAGNG
jgi:predicted nucleotidyltransferase